MDLEQRVRRDARLLAGDPEASALLDCIAEHLFDPAFDVTFLARVSGIPRQVRDRLAAKVGPLKAYITELRMMEAELLVREGEDSITEIGRRVGYRVKRTFRQAFVTAHGITPTEMREQARGPGPETTAPVAGGGPKVLPIEDDAHLTPGALAARIRRRRTLGLLGPEQATELRFRLRRRHPELEEASTRREDEATADRYPQYPVRLTPTGDHLEKIAAGTVFGEIIDMPEAEARFTLLEGVRLGNVKAFEHLYRTCAHLVHSNRERALTMAELGVQLVEQHRELLGEDRDDWKILARVLLGRVQVIAGDDRGAEKSLGFAWEEACDTGLTPWVEIELRRVEGSLRQRQRRHDEAAAALDRALELCGRSVHFHAVHAEVLLERLALAAGLGDAESGFELCNRLEALVVAQAAHGEVPTSWHGALACHRGKAFAAAGRDRDAESWLRRTIAVIGDDPAADTDTCLGVLSTFAHHELARVACRGGRLDDCESLLRTAAERYRWLEVSVFEATANAELTVLCVLRGQRSEARQLATSTAAFLDHLPCHREAWKTARRLRTLVSRGLGAPKSELLDVLAALRRDLDLVRWQIPGSQTMPALRVGKGRDR